MSCLSLDTLARAILFGGLADHANSQVRCRLFFAYERSLNQRCFSSSHRGGHCSSQSEISKVGQQHTDIWVFPRVRVRFYIPPQAIPLVCALRFAMIILKALVGTLLHLLLLLNWFAKDTKS